MTMKMISVFQGGCKVQLGSDCVKADDDNDGVTLKYYEVEESGEYADCYHKTTYVELHFSCGMWCHNVKLPPRCMVWFFYT